MKTILIIIPYFGPLPPQFNFWLKSAYNNPTINFLLFTDNELVSERNVKVINTSFENLKTLIRSKFDFNIPLSSPYKLCDFKGAYGYIFNEYITDYDFWGFGDIDLVYGNIRHFITDPILTKYKVILGWGHLTLYQNSLECNYFFKRKIHNFQYYEDIFSNDSNSCFDEFLHGGMGDMWKYEHPDLLWEERPFDDIVVPRLHFNFISAFDPTVSNNLIFEYTDRQLFRIYLNDNKEIVKELTLYAHFQQRKFMKVLTNNTEEYLIVPNAYIKRSEISLLQLKKWTRPRDLRRSCWNFKNKIVRRLNTLKPLLGMRT